jgi:lysine-specific permease
MIAIGGSIGTGIFVASGNAIHVAGPAGAMLAYGIVAVMVYFLMTSLGEMAALMPVSGSFYVYAYNFVDPAWGYALGWNYWYNWAITVASEIAAVSLVMKFWLPHCTPLLWNTLAFTLFVSLNIISVRCFAEAEYWFSIIKVSTIILFIIAGSLIACGVIGAGYKHQFWHNWLIDNGPFHGNYLTFLQALMIAGFSFQGTELIGITAGECAQPEKNIPIAIKQVFWRILLFFILSIFIISLLIPYNSPYLANTALDAVTLSPFTLICKNLGIALAASLINAVILIAILSAGNSGMYAATRMLWHLAKKSHVPQIFAKTTKRGVPIYALIATSMVAMLAFFCSLFGEGRVYFWLLNASSLSGFIAWLGIAVSHYRFRRAYLLQGNSLANLPYIAKGYPYAPLIACALCLIIIVCYDYQALIGTKINWHELVISYIGLPIFIALWLGYKYKHKTKVVSLAHASFDIVD